MKQYRQGDVFIEEVESIPDGTTHAQKGGVIVLAEGEATGHAHTIRSKSASVFTRSAEMFLSLPRGGRVSHQEHAPITLPAGKYRVVRQREYSPEEIRNVAD